MAIGKSAIVGITFPAINMAISGISQPSHRVTGSPASRSCTEHAAKGRADGAHGAGLGWQMDLGEAIAEHLYGG